MKLIINASAIYKGGAEQVAISFINECRDFSDNEYHILLRDNIGVQLEKEIFPDNFKFYYLKKRPGLGISNYIKAIRWFDKLEKQIEPDCVISTGGHGYWRPKAPLVSGFNIPHYIYPESPFFKIISFKENLYWKMKKSIDYYFYNRADTLFVQTEDVSLRLQKWIKKSSVYTISNTVSSNFQNPEIFENKLPEKEKNEIRSLTLSSYYPHKNLEIIEDIIDILLNKNIHNYKFVLTIPHDVFKEKFKPKYYPYIYNVGPVPVKECPSLYRECDFMFLPTLLECFSASYAEAMAMQKPILTSNLGFARTVCKDAAVYFDPLNANQIAEKLLWLSENEEIQNDLITNGLTILSDFKTAKDRAEQFLDICREAIT